MAIEVIAKIKQANNGTFKLIDSTDVELKDGSDLQSFLDNLGNVDGSGDGSCLVIVSDTEPEDENVAIWVDTSENDGEYTGGLEDLVIEEFRAMFKFLTGKIDELTAKNLDLEARIIYLEKNGAIVDPDDPDDPDITSGVALCIEDGSILVDENGILLTLETVSTTINQTKLTFETGEILVDEENNILILEK